MERSFGVFLSLWYVAYLKKSLTFDKSGGAALIIFRADSGDKL